MKDFKKCSAILRGDADDLTIKSPMQEMNRLSTLLYHYTGLVKVRCPVLFSRPSLLGVWYSQCMFNLPHSLKAKKGGGRTRCGGWGWGWGWEMEMAYVRKWGWPMMAQLIDKCYEGINCMYSIYAKNSYC